MKGPSVDSKYSPLLGIAVGAVSGSVFVLTEFALDSTALAAALSMIASILLTKESRVGSFSVLAIMLVLLVKFESLQAIGSDQIVVALISAQAFSRFAAVSAFTYKYAPASDLFVLAFFGMVPALFLGNLLLLCLLPVLWLVRTLFALWCVRKIGGRTGDCMDATQQVVEVCFYLALILASNFTLPLAK